MFFEISGAPEAFASLRNGGKPFRQIEELSAERGVARRPKIVRDDPQGDETRLRAAFHPVGPRTTKIHW